MKLALTLRTLGAVSLVASGSLLHYGLTVTSLHKFTALALSVLLLIVGMVSIVVSAAKQAEWAVRNAQYDDDPDPDREAIPAPREVLERRTGPQLELIETPAQRAA